MFDTASLLIFITAAVVLVVTPGPAVLYIVGRSLEQGRIAGIVSALGIASAGVVHVVLAVLGVSAILTQSEVAFTLIKYAGAAYLIYLGARTLLTKVKNPTDLTFNPMSLSQIYRQGVIVNMLNPKTALFFLAFLPQFVNPERGSVTAQLLMLGVIFVTIAVVSDGVYGIAAGSIRELLLTKPRTMQWQKYISGTIYIGLGILTALSGQL